MKTKIKIQTRASREFLATQRRMAVSKGCHWFDLKSSGKLTPMDACQFFGKCDDVEYHTQRLKNGDVRFTLVRVL